MDFVWFQDVNGTLMDMSGIQNQHPEILDDDEHDDDDNNDGDNAPKKNENKEDEDKDVGT